MCAFVTMSFSVEFVPCSDGVDGSSGGGGGGGGGTDDNSNTTVKNGYSFLHTYVETCAQVVAEFESLLLLLADGKICSRRGRHASGSMKF